MCQTNQPKVLEQLLAGNTQFVKKRSCDFEPLKQKQTPKVVLLTCCDSRVPQNLFDSDGLNEIFTIRNIGNQFRTSKGSVKYPVLHLNTPLLIVLGHTGCGAINASLSNYRGEDPAIQREITGIVNTVTQANHSRSISKYPETNQKLAFYAQTNVDHQILEIMNESDISEKIRKQQLDVVGMIFDIQCVYGDVAANVYVTNINGVTDIEEMKNQSVASGLADDIKNLKFKRL